MLELINMIPAWAGGIMIGVGVAAALLIIIAIAWSKEWSPHMSHWREWITFAFFVLVALVGFTSVVI